MSDSISREEVERVAALGRLALTPEEIDQATDTLGGILANFSSIQAIDTKNVPMAADTSGLENVTRPDDARSEVLCTHEALLAAAPDVHRDHIKVRAVFEEKTL